MQDLIPGREYIATLNNKYYSGQSVHIKHLRTDEWSDCIDIMVVTGTQWEGATDDSGTWETGKCLTLFPDGYTFEEFKPILENK